MTADDERQYRPECDHCTIRIRALACQVHTTAFGVACVSCRTTIRDAPAARCPECGYGLPSDDVDECPECGYDGAYDPGCRIETVDPQRVARQDRQSWYGEDEASEVADL